MRIIENLVDDYKISKYGNLANNLRTSQQFMVGKRSSDGINIEELLTAADDDFSRYQELIRKKLSKYYNTDFLDFSLLMGKFFGVYNLYNYVFINQNIRYKLINDPNISRRATLSFIKKNCRDIYSYLLTTCGIDKEEFVEIVSSLFDVNNDCKLYNESVVKELAYILMGNYLFLENSSSKNTFLGSASCVEYFKRQNKAANNKRLI